MLVTPGKRAELVRIIRCFEHIRRDRFAFSADDTGDGAFGVGENFFGGERRAVAAGEDEAFRKTALGFLREVHHLGNIREIVQREADGFGLEVFEQAEVVAMAKDLEIEQTDVVASFARGLGDQLKPKRLKAQVNLRIHQGAGMYEEDFHYASGLSTAGLSPASFILTWERSDKPAFRSSKQALFRAEGFDRIYRGGAARRQIARNVNGRDYADGHGDVSDRIERADVEEQR